MDDQQLDWYPQPPLSVMDVIKSAMIHVERTHADLPGHEKSVVVRTLLQDRLNDTGADGPSTIRHHLETLMGSWDTFCQPLLDLIVDAGKGRLPTTFNQSEDAMKARNRYGGYRPTIHRWSAHAMGY